MELIKATEKNLDFLFELRNEPINAACSRRGYLEWDELKNDYFHNPLKSVYLVNQDSRPVGYLIFETLHDQDNMEDRPVLEISLAIVPGNRKKGLGKTLVAMATDFAINHLGATKIVASVFSHNQASLNIFQAGSYQLVDDTKEPWTLVFNGKVKK